MSCAGSTIPSGPGSGVPSGLRARLAGRLTLAETVRRHLGIVEAVNDGDLARLRAELRAHYMSEFPSADNSPPGHGRRPGA